MWGAGRSLRISEIYDFLQRKKTEIKPFETIKKRAEIVRIIERKKGIKIINLEHRALALFGSLWRGEDGANRLVEHLFQSPLSQGRALQIFDCFDLFGHHESLGVTDWLQAAFAESLHSVPILTQIGFRSNQDDGRVGAVM